MMMQLRCSLHYFWQLYLALSSILESSPVLRDYQYSSCMVILLRMPTGSLLIL